MTKFFMAVVAAVLFGGTASAAGIPQSEESSREVVQYLASVLSGGFGLLVLAGATARLLKARKRKRLGQPQSRKGAQRQAPTFGDKSPATSGRGLHVGSTISR